MQAKNGRMVALRQEQFEAFVKGGNRNLITVGDVFTVHLCYFQVETISDCGISAKGISRKEYFQKRK